MKIVLNEELPQGESYNYKAEDAETAEQPISSLLQVNGVRGIYHVMNFLAVERKANVPWETILKDIQNILNDGEEVGSTDANDQADDSYGEVYVHVQTYKDIPLQVKVFDSASEIRLGLSERFVKAMEVVHSSEVENYILLRKWADYGIRYGEKDEVGEIVVQEIEAAYPDDRLDEIIKRAEEGKEDEVVRGNR